MDNSTPVYLTLAQVADRLQLDPKTVQRLIRAKKFPQGAKFGRARRWDLRDVSAYAWLAMRIGTGEPEDKDDENEPPAKKS